MNDFQCYANVKFCIIPVLQKFRELMKKCKYIRLYMNRILHKLLLVM